MARAVDPLNVEQRRTANEYRRSAQEQQGIAACLAECRDCSDHHHRGDAVAPPLHRCTYPRSRHPVPGDGAGDAAVGATVVGATVLIPGGHRLTYQRLRHALGDGADDCTKEGCGTVEVTIGTEVGDIGAEVSEVGVPMHIQQRSMVYVESKQL